MNVRWRLYRFNYELFKDISTALRDAEAAADFEPFATTPALDAIVVKLDKGKMHPASAKQRFIISLCCEGQPVDLDRRFLNTAAALKKNENTSTAGRRLHNLLTGGTLDDTWLADTGRGPFRGLLAPHHTFDLLNNCRPVMDRVSRRSRSSADDVRYFLRMMFNDGFDQGATLQAVCVLLQTAVENREGIAVVAV